MNSGRILLAAFGAFVAYFLLGGAIFGALPLFRAEFQKYPAVYRSQQGQMSHMPAGMAAMFLSMVALATLYALRYKGGYALSDGAIAGSQFGALIGIYAIGSFVVHNYVNLNIGLRLTVASAIASLVSWTVAGMAIGVIYRPPAPH